MSTLTVLEAFWLSILHLLQLFITPAFHHGRLFRRGALSPAYTRLERQFGLQWLDCEWKGASKTGLFRLARRPKRRHIWSCSSHDIRPRTTISVCKYHRAICASFSMPLAKLAIRGTRVKRRESPSDDGSSRCSVDGRPSRCDTRG